MFGMFVLNPLRGVSAYARLLNAIQPDIDSSMIDVNQPMVKLSRKCLLSAGENAITW